MLQVYSLYSGSGGNSYLVKDEDTHVLIDAGKSCGAIEKSLNSLGSSLSQISAIFITHEHSDHTAGLEIISKKYQIPVYITTPSYDKCIVENSFLQRYAISCPVEFEKSIGSLNIKSFPVPHDSQQNVGYIISCHDELFGIATDIGHTTQVLADSLSPCKKIILESNHDIKMVKDGPYHAALKERILSSGGHLSNDKCAYLSAYLCDKGVKEITLAHLSRENNLPKIAYEATKNHLTSCGFENIPVKIALADTIVCATDGKDFSDF